MAEHRSSISSTGPAFLSMPLQQQLNELAESPTLLVTGSTYSKEESTGTTGSNNHNSESCSLNPGVKIKSSETANGIGSNHSSNHKFNTERKQPLTITTTTHSLSSSLYVTGDNDENISNSENVTIDMIRTLPLFDAAAYTTQGDPYSNSLRCYISNMIMPNCKSSCTLRDVSSLSNVLDSINDFLRIQCITYKIQYTPTTVAFHCERNSAFASLVGPSLVFVIYLWYEQPSPKLDDDVPSASLSTIKPILIDVQRRRGCPLDLQCIRRSLFRSLLSTDDNKTEAVGSRQGMIPLDLCRTIWSRYNSSSIKEMDDATTASHEDMDGKVQATSETMELFIHYQDMLAITNTVENHRMALECLCQHTDSTVTDVAKSKAVVQAIVCGSTHDVTAQIVAQDQSDAVIIEKFRTNLLHFLTTTDSPEVTQVLATAGCAPKNLQCLALRALYTSVEIYISTATEATVLSIENDLFWSSTIRLCRQGIVTANTAPCFATVYILLVCALITATCVTEQSKQMIYDILCPKNDSTIICNELKNAHAWGKQHHCHLEEGSKRLLDLLHAHSSISDDRPI